MYILKSLWRSPRSSATMSKCQQDNWLPFETLQTLFLMPEFKSRGWRWTAKLSFQKASTEGLWNARASSKAAQWWLLRPQLDCVGFHYSCRALQSGADRSPYALHIHSQQHLLKTLRRGTVCPAFRDTHLLKRSTLNSFSMTDVLDVTLNAFVMWPTDQRDQYLDSSLGVSYKLVRWWGGRLSQSSFYVISWR